MATFTPSVILLQMIDFNCVHHRSTPTRTSITYQTNCLLVSFRFDSCDYFAVCCTLLHSLAVSCSKLVIGTIRHPVCWIYPEYYNNGHHVSQDVCVEATTGSGKTIAFGIPVFEILLRREAPFRKHEIGALVVAPTRELAGQIFAVFQQISEHHPSLKCGLLVGGNAVKDNIEDFETNGKEKQ